MSCSVPFAEWESKAKENQIDPDSISLNAAMSSCGPRWQIVLSLLSGVHLREVGKLLE